jgi:hypothetical protein
MRRLPTKLLRKALPSIRRNFRWVDVEEDEEEIILVGSPDNKIQASGGK